MSTHILRAQYCPVLLLYRNSRPKARVNFYVSYYFVFVRNAFYVPGIMISCETICGMTEQRLQFAIT